MPYQLCFLPLREPAVMGVGVGVGAGVRSASGGPTPPSQPPPARDPGAGEMKERQRWTAARAAKKKKKKVRQLQQQQQHRSPCHFRPLPVHRLAPPPSPPRRLRHRTSPRHPQCCLRIAGPMPLPAHHPHGAKGHLPRPRAAHHQHQHHHREQQAEEQVGRGNVRPAGTPMSPQRANGEHTEARTPHAQRPHPFRELSERHRLPAPRGI